MVKDWGYRLLPTTRRVGDALWAQQGWLDNAAKTAAMKSLAGLQPHLRPDGFPGGVSQANQGGEQLQRGN